MENLQAIAVLIGIVNGIQLFRTNREGFMYFCIALLCGILFGLLGYFGLTIETGIVVALASSGLYKVSTRLGGQ